MLAGMVLAAMVATPRAMAGPPTDACALLTPEQIGEVPGAKVNAGKYMTPEFTKTCTRTAPGVIVTLLLERPEMFQAGKKAPAPSEVTTAVGDEAYYLTVGTQGALHVKKGDATFKMTVYNSSLSKEAREKAERALADKVLSKL
jgi:hypothetical protein